MYQVDIENKSLIPLNPARLSELGLSERSDLQEWIDKTPEILGEHLLIIAKELILPSGTRLDLLAVDKKAALVIIELKRDDSGSEVEWQAIKYASYCSNFTSEEIITHYAEYSGTSETEALERLESFIDEDIAQLNEAQRVILCAREFHSDVASAVLWLRDYGLDISCIRIRPYVDSNGVLYVTPETIIPLPEAKDYVVRKERKEKEKRERAPWTGFWFVNVGEGPSRDWDDNRSLGFISAGGGFKYSKPLRRLEVGDQILAYIKGKGYVGFGKVTEPSRPIDKAFARDGEPLLEHELSAESPDHDLGNSELCEHAIGVNWIRTVAREDAKTFTGVFANQNVVCKLRHPETLEFLQREFAIDGG